jgi:hypothetical protein
MVQVLLAHPGQIHSLDEFVGFLAPTISSSSSALSAAIGNAPRSAAQAAERTLAPLASQVAAVKRQIQEAERTLAAKQRQLGQAQEAMRNTLTCAKADCEIVFAQRAAPVLFKADIALNSLALSRLRRSITDDYQRQIRKSMEAGTYDRMMAVMQQMERAKSIAIVVGGLQQAVQNTVPLVERSPDARPLATALRDRLARLKRELSASKPLPPEVAPNLLLAEDQAKPAAPR